MEENKQEEINPVAPVTGYEGEAKEEAEEGISCKLDSFEKHTCSLEPTLILFLGRETENPDEVMDTFLNQQEELNVNVGVLDLADDQCQQLSEKYKIDRDATQVLLFQNCEKKGGVSLSAENALEQLDKIKELTKNLPLTGEQKPQS